ncbi:hypothetical protein ACFYPT_37565 [Streptomyces sp. NPDC005529]|uniref:hypothetical protein n=1 Tax=unclassified Streptomyces TaxID=2593676 RepID=UPI0033AB0BC2
MKKLVIGDGICPVNSERFAQAVWHSPGFADIQERWSDGRAAQEDLAFLISSCRVLLRFQRALLATAEGAVKTL